MTRLTLLPLTLSVGLAAAASAAQAADTVQWAHVYEPSEAYHHWAEWGAEQIAERTDGRYEVEVFPASTLGKEVEINQGLVLGTVDIIYTGQSFAAQNISVPVAAALEEEGRGDLVGFAGERVTSGEHAEAYASYIQGHVNNIAGGLTYSEIPDRAAQTALQEAIEAGAALDEMDKETRESLRALGYLQ